MGMEIDRPTVMVTGATGFIGRALVSRLARDLRFSVRAAARNETAEWPKAIVPVQMGDLANTQDYGESLRGVSCLIHAAAHVHVRSPGERSHAVLFRNINAEGTQRLAEQAADMGVRRLVFLSSIKVNGERTDPGTPFRSSDDPRPRCAYGVSKWEAEQALARVSQKTGLEVVVIRPPLVYGPGVKANFLRLMRLIHRGWPLPLADVHNRRSMVAIDNLLDLLIRCVDHPAAANRTFLVSDGVDLSTPELIRGLAEAMGRTPRLFGAPVSLLRGVARLSGRLEEFERLTSSLQADIHPTRETLGWAPPVSVREGLLRVVSASR